MIDEETYKEILANTLLAKDEKMEVIDRKKLDAVANFICEDEMYGYSLCNNFNDTLGKNRAKVPCDTGMCDTEMCERSCPFYSKESFLKWITNYG